MTSSTNKINSLGLVLLVSITILFSLMFVKYHTDVAFSQTTTLSTTFDANESTYAAISSLGGSQTIENATTAKNYHITNTSTVLNPLLNNPTYSVTNATIAIETGTIEGLSYNKPILPNQTVILPHENVIVGQK